MKATILLMTVAALAVTAAVTVLGVNSVFAIRPAPCEACGASELAPGQEAEIPVPQPPVPLPKDFAPGQEAEGPHCIGCVKELTPGQEGLDAGIIGQPKKIQ